VDLFLYDYKATETDAHTKLIGVPNELILANLDFLYNQKAAIILRCPLIPGVNDTPEHLQGIANISAKYPDLVGLELMSYHDLGRDKGLRLGQEYPLTGIETAGEATQQNWLKALAALGCERSVIG
jgi:pyruvate-formate lyase-activating enzyme